MIDKACVYLNDCKRKKVYLISKTKRKKNVKTYQFKKSFNKEFMLTAGFFYSGKLKMRRIKKKF